MNTSLKNILVVSKIPKLTLLSEQDIDRMSEHGIVDVEQLKTGKQEHDISLNAVLDHLSGHHVTQRTLADVSKDDIEGKDLVITVGGDGTVLAVNGIIGNTPILSVNSDPSRSVGNYTRGNRDTFPQLFDLWLEQKHQEERIPRLEATIEGDDSIYRFLNDCLFTNKNPAAMTRYIITTDDNTERQFSSGVWVSTGSGSTGAIHSAGMQPVSAHQPALLYKVREAFTLHAPITLLEDTQIPPRKLSLCPSILGINLYIDGDYQFKELAPGASVEFKASAEPLILITDSL